MFRYENFLDFERLEILPQYKKIVPNFHFFDIFILLYVLDIIFL